MELMVPQNRELEIKKSIFCFCSKMDLFYENNNKKDIGDSLFLQLLHVTVVNI